MAQETLQEKETDSNSNIHSLSNSDIERRKKSAELKNVSIEVEGLEKSSENFMIKHNINMSSLEPSFQINPAVSPIRERNRKKLPSQKLMKDLHSSPTFSPPKRSRRPSSAKDLHEFGSPIDSIERTSVSEAFKIGINKIEQPPHTSISRALSPNIEASEQMIEEPNLVRRKSNRPIGHRVQPKIKINPHNNIKFSFRPVVTSNKRKNTILKSVVRNNNLLSSPVRSSVENFSKLMENFKIEEEDDDDSASKSSKLGKKESSSHKMIIGSPSEKEEIEGNSSDQQLNYNLDTTKKPYVYRRPYDSIIGGEDTLVEKTLDRPKYWKKSPSNLQKALLKNRFINKTPFQN